MDELTPEQIAELKAAAAKNAELEKLVQEKEAELAKLKDKDMNFQRFREKSEEEKKEFREKLSSEQKFLFDELNNLREERTTMQQSQLNSAKERVLASLAGEDKDLAKSIELQAGEFSGTPATPEELEKRFRNAYVIVKAAKPAVRPIYQYAPGFGSDEPGEGQEKDFVKTPRGKAAYKQLFGRPPLEPKE